MEPANVQVLRDCLSMLQSATLQVRAQDMMAAGLRIDQFAVIVSQLENQNKEPAANDSE